MDLAAMSVGLFFICWSFSLAHGIIYIDKEVHDSNSAVMNVSFLYTHDAERNSISNITFDIFKTIAKMSFYFAVNIADNPKNVGTYRELVKTVIDAEKMVQGSQANPLVKGFFASVLKCMDFDPTFPMSPGTYKIINLKIDSGFLMLLPDFRALLNFRMVGKYGNIKKMRYMSHISVSGGFKR